MVKVSNKKRKLSDNINRKKEHGIKKQKVVNPFEIHINKQKYQILGQKLKNDRGLPGVSRSKALKRRRHTLLQEYNEHNKSNKFHDKRIGEKNFSMSIEDRQMARFTAERLKSHSKKSMFNLADEEVLTHRGQTLSEIEKYDDPRSDDDDEDLDGKNSSGKLDDSFVKNAHFVGGVLKRSGPDGAKSHKELIEQLIIESKKRKAEKQKIREQTIELTEKLDSEWKDLLPLVNRTTKNDANNLESKQNTDAYDKVMRELKFEARGQPTDRLKSEDEIAKEEKEKLEKLEKERLDRMKGIVENNKEKVKHRSADDLDDNFACDSEPETTLVYDADGKFAIDPEDIVKETPSSDQEDISENEDVSDEENSDDESEDDLSDLKQDESESSENEEIDTSMNINQESDEKEQEIVTNTRKRKVEDSPEVIKEKKGKNITKETIENDEITKISEVKSPKQKKIKKHHTIVDINVPKKKNEDILISDVKTTKDTKIVENHENSETCTNEVKTSVKVDEKIKEKAANELPYTFKLPETYEELQTLLFKQPPESQATIIERMVKCNHPNLASGNKQSLGTLFAYLLQHLNDISDPNQCFTVLNKLMPLLYDLAQLNPENAHSSLIEVLKEKQNDYRKNLKLYPGMDVLLFLKLIGCLFPTSDFRHQVVTPSIIFIGQMLTNCRMKSRYDISYGIFLVTILLEYTTLSKRFMPAAINYLMGILHMSIPKCGVKLLKITPPFRSNCSSLVLIQENVDFNSEQLSMFKDDFIKEGIDENYKTRTVYTVVKLIREFYENLLNIPSCLDIFQPVLNYLEMLPASWYPSEVQKEIEEVKSIIDNGIKTRKSEFIVLAAKRPKALRLYEPNIFKIVEGRNHRIMSKEKADKSKLLHKYKREMKGALREIRRDKSFLGGIKIKQKMQSDYERKEKVKQIFSEASVQQAELNALSRKKKSK